MDENNIHDSDFALLYPDVNKEELLANEEFNLFAGSRLSAEELSEVYRGYLDLTERIRKREMEKAADRGIASLKQQLDDLIVKA